MKMVPAPPQKESLGYHDRRVKKTGLFDGQEKSRNKKNQPKMSSVLDPSNRPVNVNHLVP